MNFEREIVDIRMTEGELKFALDTSPRNTAAGIDRMSYPLLRFWHKSDKEGMLEGLESMMREDVKDWHKAETVLIKKGDKERYDVVKSWRMIHLLPVVAKVVERVILGKMVKEVDLEDTQYGSRKNRSTHDMFKQIYEFVEHNRNMKCGMLSMDVEGGFDRVDIGMLCQILKDRGCSEGLTLWVKRWTKNRCIRLRFNGRMTKDYHLNKGVPQGSPLSPFLFGIYVADLFRPRIQTRINFRAMVSSYVDDRAILISTDRIDSTKEGLREYFGMCNEVAQGRGMSFSPKKIEWIGFGEEDWGSMEIEGVSTREVKEIRIIGYRLGKDRGLKGHIEYWLERGMGVRRRIGAISRRYGSEGGLGAWECMRLIQSVYFPTVYYGLEFVSRFSKLVQQVQVEVNDTLRSVFRAPRRYANKILWAETGSVPVEVVARMAQRKGYARHIKWKYGKDYPWYGKVAEEWKDNRVVEQMLLSEKVIRTTPGVYIIKDKDKAIKEHGDASENRVPEEEVWCYTDRAKNHGMAAASWVVVAENGLIEEEHGMRVPDSWSITKIEISAIIMALKDLERLGKKRIRLFSDSMTGLEMIKLMKNEGTSSSLWDKLAECLDGWESVRMDWIPGHKGVYGNEAADRVAKAYKNRRLNENGRWKEVDYNVDQTTLLREIRTAEWQDMHDKGGHNYYRRNPGRPKHMKRLSRMDYNVLMRLRSGVCDGEHEDCDDSDKRHHLLHCNRYDKDRPEEESLYNDKELEKWKGWWVRNEYLGMGIPTNLPEQQNETVMYGNPFDNTITIERNGRGVTEKAVARGCDKCGKIHKGRCLKGVRVLDKGEFFFADEKELKCRGCGGNFGGGSTTRPGGSGLWVHLKRRKECGDTWRRLFWEETIQGWDKWDEEYKTALVIRWFKDGCKEKRIDCVGCGKNMLKFGIGLHVRTVEGCYRKCESVLLGSCRT